MTQVPYDKLLHYLLGQIVFMAVLIVTNNPLLSLLGSLVVGIGKEVRDYVTKKGNPEFLDIVATVVGGLVIYIGINYVIR